MCRYGVGFSWFYVSCDESCMNGLRKKERKEGCMVKAWSMYGLEMLIMLSGEKS